GREGKDRRIGEALLVHTPVWRKTQPFAQPDGASDQHDQQHREHDQPQIQEPHGTLHLRRSDHVRALPAVTVVTGRCEKPQAPSQTPLKDTLGAQAAEPESKSRRPRESRSIEAREGAMANALGAIDLAFDGETDAAARPAVEPRPA